MRIGDRQAGTSVPSPKVTRVRHDSNDASQQLSTAEWEGRLGQQFRAARIAAGLDQSALADAAGLSIGALRGLERGTGSTLRTVIRIARVLGREDWLASLAPPVAISPIDIVRGGRRERSRVYRARSGD